MILEYIKPYIRPIALALLALTVGYVYKIRKRFASRDTIADLITTSQFRPNSVKEMREILAAGYDPNNEINIDGGQLLWFACARQGSLDMVKLIASDPRTNLNAIGRPGWMALGHAANQGRSDVVKYLLGLKGIALSPDNGSDYSVLHFAAMSRSDEAVTTMGVIFDKHPELLNAQSKSHKMTPLMRVLSGDWHNGRSTHIVKMVRYLLEKGADPRIPDASGRTPLELANILKKSNEFRYQDVTPEDKDALIKMLTESVAKYSKPAEKSSAPAAASTPSTPTSDPKPGPAIITQKELHDDRKEPVGPATEEKEKSKLATATL